MKTSFTPSPRRRTLGLALGIGSLAQALAGQLIFNTESGVVTLDGVPITHIRGNPVSFSETAGGVSRFKVAGDLALRTGVNGLNGSTDQLTALGTNALHILVANDFIQEPDTLVDVSPQYDGVAYYPVAGGGLGGEWTTARGTGGSGAPGGGTGKPGASVGGIARIRGAFETLPNGGDGGRSASPNNGYSSGDGTPGGARIGSADGQSGHLGFTGSSGLAGVNNAGVLSGLGGLGGTEVGGPGSSPQPEGGGGAGGRGGRSIIDADAGDKGGNGFDGLEGGHGLEGGPGAGGHGGMQNPMGPAELLLSGGGGGGAGGSGAGGGGGGGGSSGGGGGGGGGAGIGTGGAGFGAGGGGGGAGGSGGLGAFGGVGGAGGHGGGAVQITAFGRLQLGGSLAAVGGVAANGYASTPGDPGSPGYPGGTGGQQGVSTPIFQYGSVGGEGGRGGAGGAGGNGGTGGTGGGGSGGTLKLIGTYIDAAAGQADLVGGAGQEVGASGRLVLGHAAVDPISFAHLNGVGQLSHVGLWAPYDQVPRMDNPYVQGTTPRIAPRLASAGGLIGGASAYGLMPAGVFSDPQIANAIAQAPAGATAMILRLAHGPLGFDQVIHGFSVLLYVNFGAAAGLPNPRLNGGSDGDPEPLATLGWAREAEFGGSGIAVPIPSLAQGSVFAVLVKKDADLPGHYAFNDGTRTFHAELVDGEARYNVDVMPVTAPACYGFIDFGDAFCPVAVSAGRMVGQSNGIPVLAAYDKSWLNLPENTPGKHIVNGVSFGPSTALVNGKGIAVGERPDSLTAVAWVNLQLGGLATVQELAAPGNEFARAAAAWTDNTTFLAVGETVVNGSSLHAALWDIGAGTSTHTDLHEQMDGLLRPSPAISLALAVQGGTVAGVWYGPTVDDQRAVRWFGGVGQALPSGTSPISQASGVSASFIAGYVAAAGFQPHHACAWDSLGNNFTLLEPPGFVSSEAVACNGTHIVGFARDAAGGRHLLLWTGLDAASAVDLTGVVPDWGGTPFPTSIDGNGNISVCVNPGAPRHGYLLTTRFPEIFGTQVAVSLQPRGGTFTAQVRPNCTATAAYWEYSSDDFLYEKSPEIPLAGGTALTQLSLPFPGLLPGDSRYAHLVVRHDGDQLATSSYASFTVPPNQPPEPRDFGGERLKGEEFRIPIGKLLAMATDAEGDSLSLVSVTPDPYGSTVAIDGDFVVYRPPGFGVSPDVGDGGYFGYTIQDSLGATAEGFLVLVVRQDGTPAPNLISIQPGAGGAVTLRFAGIPGRTYRVQATAQLAFPVLWEDLGSAVAGTDGIFPFTDAGAGNHPARYYRTVTP